MIQAVMQTPLRRRLLAMVILLNPLLSQARPKTEPPEACFSPATAALVRAALEGVRDRLQEALVNGANPNETSQTTCVLSSAQATHMRPLHYAVTKDDARAVQLLASAGADPELRSGSAGSAYMIAVTLDKPHLLEAMLQLKPVALLSRDTLETLLFSCVERGRDHCLEILLAQGAPIDLPDSAGKTIFMQALNLQRYETAQALLLRGAAVVREPTVAGVTPANAVQYHLSRVREGTASHQKLLHIQQLMRERGVRFPVPTPQELRGLRGG